VKHENLLQIRSVQHVQEFVSQYQQSNHGQINPVDLAFIFDAIRQDYRAALIQAFAEEAKGQITSEFVIKAMEDIKLYSIKEQILLELATYSSNPEACIHKVLVSGALKMVSTTAQLRIIHELHYRMRKSWLRTANFAFVDSLAPNQSSYDMLIQYRRWFAGFAGIAGLTLVQLFLRHNCMKQRR